MNEHLRAVLDGRDGHGQSPERDPAVHQAVGAVLDCLKGLSYAQASLALQLTSESLRLAAVLPR